MGLRSLLLCCAAIAASIAVGSYWIPARSSYTHHPSPELTGMRAALEKTASQRTLDDHERVSAVLLDEELRRRTRMQWAGGAAALFFALAWGAPAGSRRRTVSDTHSEEQRLAATLGDPAQQLASARRKAAQLLGVSWDAPSPVIEAALSAQLALRDPSRAQGLAPDLRQLMLEQREALVRARDLLINEADPRPALVRRA